MDSVYKIIGISITGAVIAVLLRKENPEFAVLVSIATGIAVLYLVFDSLRYAVAVVNLLVAKTGADSGIVGMVFKICGIGVVAEYFCGVIEDAGETAIAKKAEMAVKAIIFVMTLPLVIKVVENIWSLF
jgi:stage III sporulation protein AD